MKTSRTNANRQSKQGATKKPKPDIRDDMDGRKREEQGYKEIKAKKVIERKARV